MPKYKIKCVIFDFGNVVGRFDHWKICRLLVSFSGLSAPEIYERLLAGVLEKDFDEGNLTGRSFYREAKYSIGADRRLTYPVFYKIWGDIFSRNPGMEKILERVKSEIKLLLLSDTNIIHWHYFSRFPEIKKYFGKRKQQILSFRCGLSKPDQKLYRLALEKSGCRVDEVLYIDDIPKYVRTWRKLGGHGIIYNCRSNSIRQLDEKLEKYQVFK